MNVCFCTHRIPYPPNSGGRAETFGIIEGLVDRGHDLQLISYCDDTDQARAMESAVGCTVQPVAGLPNRTPRNLAANVFTREPLPVMKARTTEYTAAVEATLDRADIVHLHALQTSHLASSLGDDTPTVIRFNNVKSTIYRQYARYTNNPAKAAYAFLQYRKTRQFEGAIPQESGLTLTITAEDRDRLRQYGAGGRIEVLPAGVDLSQFEPATVDSDPDRITFFGSMDYHPNEDAAVWFVEEVLPRIRAELPDAVVEIVGKDPTDAVAALDAVEGVTVTGFVEDIHTYIDRASVVVIPIRVGTGVRMKALHAMAMGKPMVTTPVGIQGIDVEDGRHVSVAEDASSFATATLELLSDPERQRRYARNARRLIETNHDWTTIVRELERYYEAVAQ
ncbi:glycosyltransferase [Halococcus saccharolyticus]|uniref:Putative glycosyltransferase n=1 Tax=Halococcus saccharolyticus DSM 5350 TaxID=1227455 RepID=M0MHJ2_9EURY|nr:glycosyltransferase [Halococcus saccharolyticus]EMA44813.1 putative glycosyltransferase [Halococcus saccharolyticus DSM 5350]